MKPSRCSSFLALLVAGSLFSGCVNDSDDDVIVVVDTGQVAVDLQSLADYLALDVVDFIFDVMPRHRGDNPPDVAGRYFASGNIIAAVPSDFEGSDVVSEFCFGSPAGGLIDVTIVDATVQDEGALTVIEGSGDDFTAYTAFKSVQVLESGSTCEIHQVTIFSGTVEADGSLSDLHIGFGIIGIIGSCNNLLIDDFRVSLNTGDRTGEGCNDSGPSTGPANPDNVLIEVLNDLVVDVFLFLDDETQPALQVPPLGIGTVEAPPGFILGFETLQIIETDANPCNLDDVFLTDGFCGEFAPSAVNAGDIEQFLISHDVIAGAVYFAPAILNATDPGIDLFTLVNGLDCGCLMEPDPESFVIGYYPYQIDGVIEPSEVSVEVFDVATEDQNTPPFAVFLGSNFDVQEEPFRSGTVELRVE